MSDVSFTNNRSSRLYVAYMRRDFVCGSDCGDPWDVLGWIVLDPGETEERPDPTDNRWFYYYAEGDDGSTFSGDFVAEVSNERFQKCTCIGVSVSHGTNPWYEVGMRELDLDAFGGVTLN